MSIKINKKHARIDNKIKICCIIVSIIIDIAFMDTTVRYVHHIFYSNTERKNRRNMTIVCIECDKDNVLWSITIKFPEPDNHTSFDFWHQNILN